MLSIKEELLPASRPGDCLASTDLARDPHPSLYISSPPPSPEAPTAAPRFPIVPRGSFCRLNVSLAPVSPKKRIRRKPDLPELVKWVRGSWEARHTHWRRPFNVGNCCNFLRTIYMKSREPGAYLRCICGCQMGMDIKRALPHRL